MAKTQPGQDTPADETLTQKPAAIPAANSAKSDLPKHEFELGVGEAVIRLMSDPTQTIKVKIGDWRSTYEPSGKWELVDQRTNVDQKKSS
jgi:hypothetical protein